MYKKDRWPEHLGWIEAALRAANRYAAEIEPGRDVHDVAPIQTVSAHEGVRMLRRLHAACGQGG